MFNKFIKQLNNKISFKDFLQKNKYFKNQIYADTTASNLPLKCIEKTIEREIFPYYANSHANAFNGQLMKKYIQDVRNMIKYYLKCDSNNYKVIFDGNGSSSCIMHCLYLIKNNIDNNSVIMISEGEHHSNHLPWLELSKEKHIPFEIIKIDDN